jgi:hypothetical protein
VSVNLGTAAVTSAQELRNNKDFERLLEALGNEAQKRMIGAIASSPEIRTDATGYARGMYDVWEALHSAYHGVPISQVKPPAPRNSKAAAYAE